MSTLPDYVVSWMNSVPASGFRSEMHRSLFMRIRDRIVHSGNVYEELRNLYRVEQFSDFVLALMWVMNEAEKQPEKTRLSKVEESLLVDRFMQAIEKVTSEPTAEPIPDAEPGISEEPAEEQHIPGRKPAEPSVEDEISLTVFALRFEAFVEAMQAGDEKRGALLSDIMEFSGRLKSDPEPECAGIGEFCDLLVDFLAYISEQHLMDDVRVMNILSNISGDAAVWIEPNGGKREESITEAIGILKNFRSLFE